jgi:hypothetical protein
LSNSLCGDWENYNNEKCFKIISTENLLNFDDSEKACETEKGAKLFTIHSEMEQQFIEKYLFEEKKIVDNIWIGLKREKETFKWTDSSTFDYHYWAKGSPSNKTFYDCIQINPESPQMGKWIDGHCSRRNLALCQKSPDLSLIKLNKLISIVKQIESLTIKKLSDSKIEVYSGDIYKDDEFYLKTFIDTDGKQKALIFPLAENKSPSIRDKASEICLKFNSSLVEIFSFEKQIVVNSFLSKFWRNKNRLFGSFWLNGYQVSRGSFKWMLSGTQSFYMNWFPSNPVSDSGKDFMAINLSKDYNFGKWYNQYKNDEHFVFCEFPITD